MDQIISANAHDLLTCFFDECENRFRFLEEKHGYLCFSGMAEYKNNYKIIRPYKQNALQEGQPFFATTRYEKHNRTVEKILARRLSGFQHCCKNIQRYWSHRPSLLIAPLQLAAS